MRILSEFALEGEPIHRIGGKDLCALLDLSSGALTDLKKRGIAVHLKHDVYDLEATVRNYVQHLRSIAAGWGTADQAAQLTAERARLAKEQADAQAIKNAKVRGELVEAIEVERGWSDLLRKVRARILAVPPRLRQALDLGAREAEIIDRALRDALSELGNGDD
ncbi:DNA packaging protein [Cribrihabitans sp. XS_ASV171]